MEEKIIYHIDVNSAFLSWEAAFQKVLNPASVDLREIPSAVGGDREKRRGIILAKSIPAKRYGIQTGEPVAKALKKCPNLVLAKPNYNLYEQNSRAFIDLLHRFTDQVEQYSIDEVFLDATNGWHLHGNTPIEAANRLKDNIFQELGFTVNVGVSCNKLLAKMASDFRKPDLVHTLFPEEMEEKMWPLPVQELFFVGGATRKSLNNLGIFTIGDLAKTSRKVLAFHLKKHGELIHSYANGIDHDIVQPVLQANKGYGNSTTTPNDVTDRETARLFLLSLSETVCTRLRADKVFCNVVSVSIRDCEFKQQSHQITLFNPTNVTKEIADTASRLFNRMWDGTPLRHLGVHVSRITNDSVRQLTLFDMDCFEKENKMDRIVDEIRCKFGNESIQRGCFVNSEINSLSGGIPKEYRNG